MRTGAYERIAETLHRPAPPHEPLTEKRIKELYSFWVVDCQNVVEFVRAVERAHGIGVKE